MNTPVTRHKVLVLEGQEMIGLNSMLMWITISKRANQAKGNRNISLTELIALITLRVGLRQKPTTYGEKKRGKTILWRRVHSKVHPVG